MIKNDCNKRKLDENACQRIYVQCTSNFLSQRIRQVLTILICVWTNVCLVDLKNQQKKN